MVSQTAVNVVDTAFVGHLPATSRFRVSRDRLSLADLLAAGCFLSGDRDRHDGDDARRHGEAKDHDAGVTLMSAAAMALVSRVVPVLATSVLPMRAVL